MHKNEIKSQRKFQIKSRRKLQINTNKHKTNNYSQCPPNDARKQHMHKRREEGREEKEPLGQRGEKQG